MTEVSTDKKMVSTAEFEKRVEIEAVNLMYFDYMRKEKAFEESRRYIESKFQIA
jgi:hypothetical protein